MFRLAIGSTTKVAAITMKYSQIKPSTPLQPFIDSFWELKGEDNDNQPERIFPDGCPGIVINLGEPCKTDNGLMTMDYGKTYVVGAMNSFKDSFVDSNTHLLGVCFRPAAFSAFFTYAPLNEITNQTVEFDLSFSFDLGRIARNTVNYLNGYFLSRHRDHRQPLQSVLNDIDDSKGNLSMLDLAKRNFMTIRQLERNFQAQIGISPKEYTNIIRFQSALYMLRHPIANKTLADIAFECGYYDHSHLTNEVKRHTGLNPSEF